MKAPRQPVGAPTRVPRASGQAWIVTFADLVALLLAFFVLLFSMSRVEQEQWRSLISALSDRLNAIRSEEPDKPAVRFQLEAEPPAPAASLDYLSPLLADQRAAEPALQALLIWRRPGALVLSLPARALFAPDGATPAPGAEATVFSVGGLLRSLSNAIEIVAYAGADTAADDPAARWDRALYRAALVAGMLAENGFAGATAVRAAGDSSPAPFAAAAQAAGFPAAEPRIDVVIRDVAPEAP